MSIRPCSAAEVDPHGVEPGTGPEGRLTENLASRVAKGNWPMIAALVRSIFEQPDRETTWAQLTEVVD